MAYNFHGVWDRKTGHHSPLYARPDEKNYQRTLNAVWYILHIIFIHVQNRSFYKNVLLK